MEGISENLMVQRRYLQRVYFWMFVGLFVSGSTAYIAYRSPFLSLLLLENPLLFLGLFFGELFLVVKLTTSIDILTPFKARVMYILYTFATGLTLSVIFFLYTERSIYSLFGASALVFGIMSLYGYTTNADLSDTGSFLMIIVVGLIAALVSNMFLQSSELDFIISIVGILTFAGLTVYDTQKLKRLSQGDLEVLKEFGLLKENKGENETETDENEKNDRGTGINAKDAGGPGQKLVNQKAPELIAAGAAAQKEAIIGALMLYLDFVNLFLYILRAMGDNNDNN